VRRPLPGTLLASPANVLDHPPLESTTNDGAEDRRAYSPSRRVGTARARLSLGAQHAASRSAIEVAADTLTRWAASTPFLLVHIVWFAGWMVVNSGAFGFEPFDPFPFGLLTMIVSLEAIFLTIFVLMVQSRESSVEELREEVSLQVILRMEEEVTKTLQLVAGLYARLGQTVGEDPELREMLSPLDAEDIERGLIRQIEDARRTGRRSPLR